MSLRQQKAQEEPKSAPVGPQRSPLPRKGVLVPFFYVTDPMNLGLFRFFFGLMMAWNLCQKFFLHWGIPSSEDFITYRDFHFKYKYFEWVPVPTEALHIRLVGGVLVVSSLFLGLAWWYRVSAVIFFLTYTWYVLWDASYYNNHYYLTILLAFCFVITDCHHWGYVRTAMIFRTPHTFPWTTLFRQRGGMEAYYDTEARKNFSTGRVRPVRGWQLWLFRFQVLIPYFFGGVSKINPDWLRGYPPRLWMQSLGLRSYPALVGTFTLAWGGLVFDLLAPFLLLNRSTRVIGFFGCLLFHIINATLFSIGNFPWLMVASLVLYFDTDTLRFTLYDQMLHWGWELPCTLLTPYYDEYFVRREDKGDETVAAAAVPQTGERARWCIRPYTTRHHVSVLAFLCVWVLIQVGLPLRHYVYHMDSPHTTHWSENGHRFSWRMMLRYKSCDGEFHVVNTATNQTVVVRTDRAGESDPIPISNRHLGQRFKDPMYVRQYGQYLGHWFRENHWDRDTQVRVYCESQCALNGSPLQPFTNAAVDLVPLQRPGVGGFEEMLQTQTLFV